MQKSTLQKMLNNPARHGFATFLLHEPMRERKVFYIFFMKNVSKWLKIALQNFAKILYILYVFSLSKGFFGQKSRKLTEHNQNFLCT